MIKNKISFFIKDTYSGSAADPLSLNLYTYCANNPLIYIDPTGNTYVPLEVPSEYVNKHYSSVKAYDLELQKQAFLEKTWPTYKEDIALSRQKLREQGWILPLTTEEQEYSNYIFYEHSTAKRDRMLYGMVDEAKASYMDLVLLSDFMMSQKLGFNVHLSEFLAMRYTPKLVNDSSYVEELISPFISPETTKQSNFIERELHDAEMQGRLAVIELQFVLEMASGELLATQKLRKLNKVLSPIDDTKQFWDDFAQFFNKNKCKKGISGKPSLWDKNWKPAVEPDLQLFAKKSNARVGNKAGNLSKEIQLPKVKTYEQARNKAFEITGDMGANSKPYIGRLKSSEGYQKIVGRQTADGKLRWRLDYDPEKGMHINIEDFRGKDSIKQYIQFEGSEETFKALLKNLNK